MLRVLGSDVMRGIGWSRRDTLDNIRPFENGQRWPSSRGSLGSAVFAQASRFEADRIETYSRKGAAPTPIVSRGHTLDANTIALWRFDDARPDNRASAFLDSRGVTWTLRGSPGICSFNPITGAFARKFVSNRLGNAGDRTFMTLATSTAIRNMLIGSCTWEGYVRIDSDAAWVLWSHCGDPASESTPNNTIGTLIRQADGFLNYNWEYAAAANETPVQTAGAKMIVGQWHYVAIVKDTVGKTVKYYLDGALAQSVAYVNEPTDSSAGGLAIAGQTTITSSGAGGDISVRSMQWSTVARPLAWIEENQRNFAKTGLMVRDASVLFATEFLEAPSAEDISGYGHHLTSTATGADGTSPTFSLISDDAGAGRSFLNCTLATWHSETIRSAMLNDFTAEVWIQIIGPVPSTGNGIFHWGGDPASETQENNRHGLNIPTIASLVFTMEHGAGVNMDAGDVYTVPTSFELGRRYHIALRKTMTAGTWTGAIFINGSKVAESFNNVNGDGTTRADQVQFQVGGGCGVLGDISRFFGFLDDFRLSNVARTDLEIQQSFQSGGGIDAGVAPTITIISPTPGPLGTPGGFSSTWEIARLTPIVVQIDAPTGLGYVCVVARFPTERFGCEVYRRGKFRQGFTVSSFEEVVGTKLYLHVLPDEGWKSWADIEDIAFDCDAIGDTGELSAIEASS